MKKLFVLLLAAMPLLVGCNDFDPFRGSETGKPITFSANTYYQNGIGTRTEYSGEFFGDETKYERINWVDEDLLRIWAQVDASTKENGDYSVESHETDESNQQNSNAKVKSVGTPLTWLSNATHTIYALYPSPNTENFTDASKVSLNGNVITATIPATQVVTAESGSKVFKPDMNYAFMWAATQATPGNNVSLPFKPLMTTFEFTVVSPNSDGAQLHSFALRTDAESPVIAGDFTAAVSDDLASCTITDIANGATAINVDLGDVVAASDSPVTFTIFALPQDLTNLTMEFTLTDNTVKKLDLKRKEEGATEYTFITFEAGKKYRITNVGVPGDGWIYTLEEVEPGTAMARTDAAAGTATKEMYSYRTKDGVTEAVEMQFRYSPADEETGENLEDWSSDLPDWLTSMLVGEHTDEQSPNEAYTLTGTYIAMPANQEITLNQIEEHSVTLKAKGTNGGSLSAPQDLALYDVGSLNPRSGNGIKTANSYVVNRAGWYMFPLVYGNALDCEFGSTTNGWNERSYVNSYATGSALIPRFRNYVNDGITTPYILDDTGLSLTDVEAVIVWEDVLEDELFINPDDVDVIEPDNFSASYKDQDGNTKSSVPFIVFNVPRNTIREGNAVIALREKNDDKRIIWSWHIWISDADFSSTTTLKSRSTTVPINQMLAKPLGFCDDIIETRTYYIPRKYFVEVSQAEGNAAPVIFEITQVEDDELWRSMPTMTHYQPTRKDPFLPQTSDLLWFGNLWFDYMSANSRDKNYYSPEGYQVLQAPYILPVANNPSSSSFDFSYGIQNPTVVFTGGLGGGCWIGGNITPLNLWNMSETSATTLPSEQDTFNPDLDKVVIKTIQDPCPPGFSVPSYGAFTIFTSNGNNTGTTNPPGVWNVDNDNSSNFGYTFYTNDEQTQTMYIPATGCRYNGYLHTPTRTGSFYLTAKVSGDRYFTCFTRNRYWGNPGPVDSMSKGHCWAVWPATEVNTNR